MRVIRVTATNFRGLSEKTDDGQIQAFRTIDFDPKFNVIIGVNGIGKTSILDILAILISRVLPRTTPALGRPRRFIQTDVRAGGTAITGRIWLDFDNNILPYGLTEAITQPRSLTEDADKQQFRQIAEQYDRSNTLSGVSTPIALLYTTDRAGFRLPKRAGTAPPLGRAAAYQGALVEKMVNYGSVAAWLRTRQVLAKESTDQQRLLEIIEAALRRFLPAFGEIEAELDPPRLYVKKKGIRLGIEQLSDGERSFLAMVVDTARHLAQANPESSDPLTEGKGVVLIDELELHLHPKWQRSSVEHLQQTFPGIQFITTTHSPFVIQSLQPGQLINLDPESFEAEYADKSIEDITEAVMGVSMPQKSERYQRMIEVAERYYQTLSRAKGTDGAELESLKRQLDELSIPFSDDPAFTAFLKFQRESTLQEDETN